MAQFKNDFASRLLYLYFKGARHRAGIMGIERSIQQRQKNTDKNITQAFQDLSKLMEKVQS